MDNLSNKILVLLKENNIKNEDILTTLNSVYKQIEISLWENVDMSPSMFYNLKDVIWYNLEHVPNNGEKIGLSSLKHLGSKYPYLIYCCNNSDIISIDVIPFLLEELNSIISNWGSDWKLVELYTMSDDGWENSSKIIIYDALTESPSKYGYNRNYNSLLDKNGDGIKVHDTNTVLCKLNNSIGEYSNGNILYNLAFKLRETCKRALKSKKDIKIDFDSREER